MHSKGVESEKAAAYTQGFSDDHLKIVETSENDQGQLKDWVLASKRFSAREKAAYNVHSVDAFREYWQDANSAKEDFDQSHEKGCGLWAKRYQSSTALIKPFFDDFSPLVRIVKDLGAPYGGVALATMTLLFAVAVNKNEMEESLALTISSIRDRLPGLRLYQRIYDDDLELDRALQKEIIYAYRGFMDFCTIATRYYKRGGPRRWLRALIPANTFSDKANEVKAHIVQIRLLGEELLNRNVGDIKCSNMRLEKDNIGLKAQITELQQRHDHDRLAEVQRLLRLENFSKEEHSKTWCEHSEAVDRDDGLNYELFQQMRGPELHSFLAKNADYRAWEDSTKSCLLVLSGRSIESYQCWLSPIAAATVKGFEQQKVRPLYAYYALPQFPQSGKLLYDVVSVILLQLLRQKSHALRDEQRYSEFRTELSRFYQAAIDERKKVTEMEKVAVRALDFFDDSETLYIVVDRADRCQDPKTVDHRKNLLKVFVKMVEASTCKLKILTVVDGNRWRVVNYQDELGAKINERIIVHRAEQGMTD